MERLVEKGLAKNIGVSNFNANQLKEVLECCKVMSKTLTLMLLLHFPNTCRNNYFNFIFCPDQASGAAG